MYIYLLSTKCTCWECCANITKDYTTVVEVKENVHDTVIKAFDSVIKLNDIFMTSEHFATVVEVKENIRDTIIMVS